MDTLGFRSIGNSLRLVILIDIKSSNADNLQKLSVRPMLSHNGFSTNLQDVTTSRIYDNRKFPGTLLPLESRCFMNLS